MHKTLAQKVKSLRLTLGLTQAELAQSAKVTSAEISLIENDKIKNLKLTTAIRLAEALRTSVGDLAFTATRNHRKGVKHGQRKKSH